MRTAEQWCYEGDFDDHAAPEEWVKAIQRDAWGQGVRDERRRRRAEDSASSLADCPPPWPVFPDDKAKRVRVPDLTMPVLCVRCATVHPNAKTAMHLCGGDVCEVKP